MLRLATSVLYYLLSLMNLKIGVLLFLPACLPLSLPALLPLSLLLSVSLSLFPPPSLSSYFWRQCLMQPCLELTV